ncbi:22096_t:CDS:2, partial [Gigaspora rosea]
MPRESMLQKANRQLSSNNIVEGALTYLKATKDLLVRQHRRKEISEEVYKFRIDEIIYFKNTIEKLAFKVKNLQNEINKPRKENKDLQEKMNNLTRNFKILAEIANNLSPRDILNIILVKQSSDL